MKVLTLALKSPLTNSSQQYTVNMLNVSPPYVPSQGPPQSTLHITSQSSSFSHLGSSSRILLQTVYYYFPYWLVIVYYTATWRLGEGGVATRDGCPTIKRSSVFSTQYYYKFTFCMLKTNNKDINFRRKRENHYLGIQATKGKHWWHYEGAWVGPDHTNRGQSVIQVLGPGWYQG